MRIIILIIFLGISTFAEDSFKPKFTLNYGYNMHNASFKELPNVPNCCDEFNGGNGFGLGIGLGFDYIFDNKLFGIADYYSFGIMYRDYSGLLEKDVESGNLIREFGYEPAFSNISLDASLSYVFTSHYLNFHILENAKTDFFVNFDIGFALSGNYAQKEEALRPDDYTFENGARIRDESNGDINDLNSLFLAIGAGFKYNAIDIGGLDLIPELSYRYSLLPVVNSLDWNVSSIEFGVSISGFDFSREETPEMPPPAEPLPPPEPKEVAKVEQLKSEITLSSPSNINNGIINYSVKEETYKEVYSLPPVIYYKDQEISPAKFEGENLSESFNIYGNQEDLIKTIAKKIKESSSLKLVITTTNEREIAEQRKQKLWEELKKDGLNESELRKIDVIIETKPKDQFKYEELSLEYEKAEFIFEDAELIPYKFREYKKINIQDEIDIDYNISSNLDIAKPRSTVDYLNKNKKLEKSDKVQLSPSDLMNFYKTNQNTVVFSANVAADEQYQKKEKAVKVIPEIETVEYVNYNAGEKSSQYILGYFEFDKSSFSKVDKETVERVEEALKEGKDVTFYPLTDNLGADNYNSNLSRMRLKSALALFKNSDKIKTEIPEKPFFNNGHPFGRSLNRSIVVRIGE